MFPLRCRSDDPVLFSCSCYFDDSMILYVRKLANTCQDIVLVVVGLDSAPAEPRSIVDVLYIQW